MIRAWRAMRQAKLLSTFLVAVVMLVAPLTTAIPLQCHDDDGPALAAHATVSDAAQHVVASGHVAHPDASSQGIDQEKCCDFACGAHAIAVDSMSESVLDLPFIRRHFDRTSQVARGLAVSPGLEPPRFRA